MSLCCINCPLKHHISIQSGWHTTVNIWTQCNKFALVFVSSWFHTPKTTFLTIYSSINLWFLPSQGPAIPVSTSEFLFLDYIEIPAYFKLDIVSPVFIDSKIIACFICISRFLIAFKRLMYWNLFVFIYCLQVRDEQSPYLSSIISTS